MTEEQAKRPTARVTVSVREEFTTRAENEARAEAARKVHAEAQPQGQNEK